jgi:hypothetical protein
MKRHLVRPALVPAAIAVSLPCALVQWSLLAAGLSLPLSVILIFVGMQITRDQHSSAEFKTQANLVIGAWYQNDGDHGGAR